MTTWFFVTDLHGNIERYEKLWRRIEQERPRAVLFGGDLLPHGLLPHSIAGHDSFSDYLVASLRRLRSQLKEAAPRVFVILGNDDPRCEEPAFTKAAQEGVLSYQHETHSQADGFDVYGYACVPPTPFQLKDWERYDVSRYTPPGAISPEEGRRSVEVPESEIKWGTIAKDLPALVQEHPLDRAVLLFHTPPYDTPLDRAALDGKSVEHVPFDVHVGSIAVRRFIEERQPLLTLHGHVHESTQLTGEWKIQIGRTVCINGAHAGPELSLVRFDPARAAEATRELI
jgi:uncharacterized protein